MHKYLQEGYEAHFLQFSANTRITINIIIENRENSRIKHFM